MYEESDDEQEEAQQDQDLDRVFLMGFYEGSKEAHIHIFNTIRSIVKSDLDPENALDIIERATVMGIGLHEYNISCMQGDNWDDN